jgi:hypothetical protein
VQNQHNQTYHNYPTYTFPFELFVALVELYEPAADQILDEVGGQGQST